MLYSEYEKILTKGERVDWYGVMVPKKLITNTVKTLANQIVEQINKYEDVNSVMKKSYICDLWENVRNLPYKINDDFYLVKKKEIESKMKPIPTNDSIKNVEQKKTKK